MKNQLFALLKWFYMIFFNNCRSTILSKPGGKLHFSILVWSIKPLIYVICDPDRKEEKTRDAQLLLESEFLALTSTAMTSVCVYVLFL